MKQFRIGLVSLTFVVSFTGVVIAKMNGQKRTSFDTAYYTGCVDGGWHSVILDDLLFDDQGITNQAALRTSSGSLRALWKTQQASIPVKFLCP